MTDPTQRMQEILEEYFVDMLYTRDAISEVIDIDEAKRITSTALAELSKLMDEARIDEVTKAAKVVENHATDENMMGIQTNLYKRIAALRQPNQSEETEA